MDVTKSEGSEFTFHRTDVVGKKADKDIKRMTKNIAAAEVKLLGVSRFYVRMTRSGGSDSEDPLFLGDCKIHTDLCNILVCPKTLMQQIKFGTCGGKR